MPGCGQLRLFIDVDVNVGCQRNSSGAGQASNGSSGRTVQPYQTCWPAHPQRTADSTAVVLPSREHEATGLHGLAALRTGRGVGHARNLTERGTTSPRWSAARPFVPKQDGTRVGLQHPRRVSSPEDLVEDVPVIEIIRTLIETLANGFPGIAGMREDKRRRQLGAELFLLYANINQLMLTAEDIIQHLEQYAACTERDLNDGSEEEVLEHSRRVTPLVERQRDDLLYVRLLLDSRSAVVQIIEPDAYNRLVPLLGLKQGALDTLSMIMYMGDLPLDPSQAEIDAWMARLPPLGESRTRGATRSLIAVDRLIRDSGRRWRENVVPRTSWGQDVHARIVQYLDERQPRRQLEEIRSALALLRSTLLENFTIADVLLEVGERGHGVRRRLR